MVSAASTGVTDAASNPHSSQRSGGASATRLLLLGLGLRHPVDQVRGQQVVVVVADREAAATARERAQVDGVAEHLGGRHEGGDHLLAVANRIGALHPPPARVEV